MILYHFTARERLRAILEEGLRLGDVPVNGPTGQGLNAVWLTSDPTLTNNGLGSAGEMSDQERYRVFEWRGVLPEPGTRWLDKRAVRITVQLPSTDRSLKSWLPWARKRIAPAWLNQLHQSGGGLQAAKSWWLYFGTIKPSNFAEIIETATSAASIQRPLECCQTPACPIDGRQTMRLLRENEVLERVPGSRSSLYARIKAGTFPSPVKLGRLNAWSEDEVDRYIADRIAERGTG